MWLFVVILGITSVFAQKCGYESCALLDKDKINVHIVPHSHDDVGWLKTMDEYYYGAGGGPGVKYIITSVVDALKQNSNRKFSQVETAYFWKWWKDATAEMRTDFQNLVNNGQIEIVNGGWVMNDEACTSYQSIIDQFTLGLRTINETLGDCGRPKVGWQIDPFGHSSAQAAIFSQMGFDGLFFSRLDYNERENRMKTNQMEFNWKTNTGKAIFTNILPFHYSAPSGFCWDIFCQDEPFNTDPDSFDYNVPRKVQEFEKVLDKYSPYRTTENILVPMGEDFQYEEAEMHFINMDILMKEFKNHTKYNVFYSTPSYYVRAVSLASPNLTEKTGDFFPYAKDRHSYWTGFYTSRPNSKRLGRIAHSNLQAAKQLTSIHKILTNSSAFVENLRSLSENSAVMQHHDAITGTERQAVTGNYVKLLLDGIESLEKPMGLIFGHLLKKVETDEDMDLKLSSCLLANVSICEISSNSSNFVVAVYNPLSRPVTHCVRLPVPDVSYTIIGPKGENILNLVVKSISDFAYVQNDQRPSPKELVFCAKDVPALGMNLYYVSTNKTKLPEPATENLKGDNYRYGTKNVYFDLDPNSNLLKSVTMNNVTVSIRQEFHYYNSENGKNNDVPSGAYVFRPIAGTTKSQIVTEKPATIEYAGRGNNVYEVHLAITDWIKQIIRVYNTTKEESYIEFDWLVGPVEVNETERIGKEVIVKFIVDNFDNNGTFYTDSNGKDMIRRIRNSRSDYEYDPKLEPISSNYYPVTSRIVIKDESQNLEVAVFTDRSQGGSSLKDGEIELMVHRRVLVDASSLGEPLNETEFNQGVVVRGKHVLMIGSTNQTSSGKSIAAQQRDLAQKQYLSPWILVGNATSDDFSLDNLRSRLNFEFRFLSVDLPANINILTFEPWQNNAYLLRLEHTMGPDEDAVLSKNVTVNLLNIFSTYTITDIRETLLDGSMWLQDSSVNETNIELAPMQIRTFVISIV